MTNDDHMQIGALQRAADGRVAPIGSFAVPFGLFVGVAVWLFAAALLVDLEYYDGYSAICNARFFLGLHEQYIGDRMPMMSIVLLPAELCKTWMGMHPLEVRPHHLTLAVLHTAYLVWVYLRSSGSLERSGARCSPLWPPFLTSCFSRTRPSLAMTCCQAPLLWMLIWSEDYRAAPKKRIWLALVALGTTAALLKQTYAIFWIIVLLVHAFPLILANAEKRARGLPVVWRLGAAAAVSGAITWIVLGCVFATCAPEVPLLALRWCTCAMLRMFMRGRISRFQYGFTCGIFPRMDG